MLDLSLLVLTLYSAIAIANDPVYFQTIINLERSTRIIRNHTYPSYSMTGVGSNWKHLNGIYGYVIPEGEPFSVIYVNKLANETTIIHAHGQTPPPQLDGVQYLSALPIFPNYMHRYEYNLEGKNTGTYWMHSHWGFQAGEGMAVPLIVKGDPQYISWYSNILKSATEVVMLIQDVCPYTENDDVANLHCDPAVVLNQLRESWEEDPVDKECPGVESANGTDVLYADIWVNGRSVTDAIHVNVPKGIPVRLRVINASAMTNYLISIPALLNATLIATDSKFVHPIQDSSFWISVAQRLDILLFPDQDGLFPIGAITESVYDGQSKQGFLVLQVNTNSLHAPFTQYSSVPAGIMSDQTEKMLRAYNPLPTKNPDRIIKVVLTGDNGFKSINGNSYGLPPMRLYQPNTTPLTVKKGERVHIEMINTNPDSHAMHLHGHFVQVVEINGVPVNGAIRDVVLVPGGCGSAVVAFDADHPGKWLFHCHMEFHMNAGMLTTLEYELDVVSTSPPTQGNGLYSYILIVAMLIKLVI